MTVAQSGVMLVRHGESTWNRAGRVQGQTPRPRLTRRGRAQARALATALASVGVTRILTSDLRRATQTAAILGRVLGVVPEPTGLLRERHWGTWQGRRCDAAEAHARTLAHDERLLEGESVADVRERVDKVLADLVRQTGVVVLVTHGDVIASLFGTEAVANGSTHRVPLAQWDTPTPGAIGGTGLCKGVRTS